MSVVIAAAVVGIGVGAYTVRTGEMARKKAKEQMAMQGAKNKKLENEMLMRQKEEESQEKAKNIRDAASARVKAKSAMNANRNGTMITSPLGSFSSTPAGSANSGKKLIGQ